MNENLFDTGVSSGMSTPIPDVGGLDVNLMQPFMDTASSQPDFGCIGGQSQEAPNSSESIWASPSVEDSEFSQGGHSPTFCGSRESILKDLRQAQSDVAYYTKEIQHNKSDIAAGWIGIEPTLRSNQAHLEDAMRKVKDLQAQL